MATSTESRNPDDELLLPAVADQIDHHLEACLTARGFLHRELLADPLEAKSFGLTAANAADVLERRLQLLELAWRKMAESTEAGGVNERPLCALGLGRTDLWKGYIPLALLLKERIEERRRQPDWDGAAFVLGINAPPGSGKSTLVQVLLFLLSVSAERPLRAVQLSSDDLYMPRVEREAAGIATRLDPRAIDPALHGLVAALKHADGSTVVELPRYNKGRDEREAVGTRVRGPFDLVLYEGWRVGVERGEMGGNSFDYARLNAPIDFLLYIQAEHSTAWKPFATGSRVPHAMLCYAMLCYIQAELDDVWQWKLQSSKRDHEREVGAWGAREQAALQAA